jgi:hypothetical protein
MRSAYASIFRPAGMSVAVKQTRMKLSSSAAMRLDTAACVVCSFSAVSRKF